MDSRRRIDFVNPVRLCGLVVLIISAPKVLTQTNCECLVISKHSGDEWTEDCGDTTTEFTSTTYTITTPADVAAPPGTTKSPVVFASPSSHYISAVPPLNTPKPTIKAPVLTTKAGSLTTKGSVLKPKPTTKPGRPTKVTTSLLTKLNTVNPTAKGAVVTTNKAPEKTTKPSGAGEPQAESVSESAVKGSSIGVIVGAVTGATAIVSAVILFWKLGLIKKCRQHSCRRSKVGVYDAENGEATQNGTKPAEKTLKTL